MKTAKNRVYGITAGVFMLFSACCENPDITLPGGGNETYINFYQASEVIKQENMGTGNMVYINDSVPKAPFLRFPQFSVSASYDGRQYPQSTTGTDLVSGGDAGGATIKDNYRSVYWMHIQANSYKFIFTSEGRTFLKDTTLTLLSKTYTTQYLVESPASDSAYTIVTVPVERKGTEGQVRIQVVNLAVDLGAIDVYRMDAEGKVIDSGLPLGLAFGDYSSSAGLDISSGTAHGDVLLRIHRKGDPEALLILTVPAISNSAFTIVVQGFEHETQRRIKIQDTEYREVTVYPNLRTNIRRIF